MKIIYDFDGTLTPYGIPQYEILKKCGYIDNKLLELVSKIMKEENASLYQAFYKAYEQILQENNLDMSYENITLGSNNVEFNNGVLEYFKDLQTSNTDIKHYIVTSGFKEYVCKTKVAPLVNEIYGVTYKNNNGIYTEIDELISDELKPVIISKIIEPYDDESIIYIGDGLTDRYAFEYVHSIGGTCLYVGSTSKDFEDFNNLKTEGIVDEYFSRDFSKNSKLRIYIEDRLNRFNKKISI